MKGKNQNFQKVFSFLLCVIIVVCSIEVSYSQQENIYISQSAKGNDTGSDAANAHAVNWFNNSANWTTDINNTDGLIGPRDVIHLCGVISTSITIQGSGTEGNPITILFEENARLSSPCFDVIVGNHNDGAIAIVDKEYIIIDGGNNGIIENTNTGTKGYFSYYRTNQNDNNIGGTIGICIAESHNVAIKNIQILNLYQSVDTFANPSFEGRLGDIGAHTNSRGILIYHSDTVDVLNSTITYTGFGIIADILENENININNNVFSRCGAGIVAAGIVNHDNPSIIIHHNYIYDCTDWGYNDGMKFFGADPTKLDPFKGIRIYNNIIGPDISTEGHPATAWIVADQGFIVDPEIHNNVFIAGPNDWNTDRAIHIIELGGNYHVTGEICPQNSKIYNNTIVSESPNTVVGIIVSKGSVGNEIYNNVIKAASNIISISIGDDASEIDYCDNNNYYSTGDIYFTGWSNLETWQNDYGFDNNSIFQEPEFVDESNPVGMDNAVFTRDDGFVPASAFLGSGGRYEDYLGAYEFICSDTININIEICEGNSYFAGGKNQITTGTYYDTLQNAAGCDSIITTNLTIIACNNSIDNINDNTIKIYPNPGNSILTIDNQLDGETIFEIYNLNGTKILEKVINTGVQKVNISLFENGIYIYKIRTINHIIKYGKVVIYK